MDIDALWWRLEHLQEAIWQEERNRHAAWPPPARPWFGQGPRIQSVRSALWHSGPEAARMLAERLAGIELSAVARILLSASEDIALLWGGSALLGGAAGGLIGALGAGFGAGPGAMLGIGVGMQVGAWVLGLMGLASLLEDLGHALPQALRDYALGIQKAWGHGFMAEEPDALGGARHIAHGHLVLMTAVLSALAAYLTRGRGDPAARARILQEIRQSRRLGPKVADWVEANEDKLIRHPSLQPKERQIVMSSQATPPAGPPVTPSQLRREAGRGDAAASTPKQEPFPEEAPRGPVADQPFTARSVFAIYPQSTTLQFGSIQEQAKFLAAHIPGLSPAQAEAILDAGFSRSSSVVFGGSRVRGNFTHASDLDVGFGSLSERQAQRVIGSINNKGEGLALERLTIVPGKATATINPIASPEEFFQRSGVRAGGDLRAGQPFAPSGSMTATKDGCIALIPPEQQ